MQVCWAVKLCRWLCILQCFKGSHAFSASSQLSSSTKNGLLNPEDEGNYTPDNTASQPVRLQSSAMSPQGPQILHNNTC